MESLAWDLWLGIFGLGSLTWYLWLEISGLRAWAWDLWLDILGMGNWAPEAGGTSCRDPGRTPESGSHPRKLKTFSRTPLGKPGTPGGHRAPGGRRTPGEHRTPGTRRSNTGRTLHTGRTPGGHVHRADTGRTPGGHRAGTGHAPGGHTLSLMEHAQQRTRAMATNMLNV